MRNPDQLISSALKTEEQLTDNQGFLTGIRTVRIELLEIKLVRVPSRETARLP